MAEKNRHNVAFVVGSIVGAVVGAATALWKTPYSGEELRSKLGVSRSQDASTTSTLTTGTTREQRPLTSRVLSGVEKTLAPVVGVQLGKTANEGAASSDMRVNSDLANTGTTGGDVSVTRAADGSETLGLSLDRVDADKWAAAYAGTDLDAESSSTSTAASTPDVTQTSAPAASTGTSSEQSSLLRHPHSWHGYGTSSTESTTSTPSASTAGTSGDVSVTHAADGSTMIGLSRDKVDADRWAAAYAGEDLDATSSSSTAGTTSTSGRDFTSNASESAAQTGLGAAPAYPGSDQIGHPPVDPTAPDTSVADVSSGAGTRDRGDDVTTRSEAATTEQLSTPQVDRVPDSLRPPTEHGGMRPFPTLGGKEDI